MASSLKGKRICIVFETLDLGGAERQGLLLARYLLNECGADVHVLGFRNPGRAADLCDQYGIPWTIVPSFRWDKRRAYPVALWRVLRELRRIRPEVIMAYTILPNVICGLIWRWTGAKVCVWNQRDDGVHRADRDAERMAVRNTRWFFSNSAAGRDFLTDTLNVDTARVQVVHNGVELAPAAADRNTWRAKLGIADDVVAACMVANLHANKDHPTLLRAWGLANDKLRSSGRSAVLLLAGRPSGTEEQLRLLAEELGISEGTRFLGGVDDISGLLAASDIGVFSSVTEGCPNGVLEPMAAGLPIVATDIPSIRDVVGPSGYEWLSAVGDAEGMAERIYRMVESKDIRDSLGAVLRQRIREEFTPKLMCERTENLIVQSLSGGR